jgi:hypothetical protein
MQIEVVQPKLVANVQELQEPQLHHLSSHFMVFTEIKKKHCQRTKVCSKILKIMLSSQCGLLLGSLHYRHETCATRILPVLPSWNNQPSLSSCPLPHPGSPLLIPHCRMTIGCWETKGGEAKPEKTLHLSQAPPTPTIPEWLNFNLIWTNLPNWWKRLWSFLLLLVWLAITAFSGQVMKTIF